MAYFNHAFKKTFLATGIDQNNVDVTLLDGSTWTVSTADGFVTTPGMPTYGLNELSQLAEAAPSGSPLSSGYIGYFNPRTNLSVDLTDLPEENPCCPLYLAGSAIYSNDRIGRFHGGYQETNKSKVINPRYVTRFYSVDPCEPSNEVLHVGSTYWTAGTAVATISLAGLPDGTGYTNGTYAAATTGSVNGSGLILEITVAGGIVTNATIIAPGKGYAEAETITIVGGNNDATVTVVTLIPAGVDPITGSNGPDCTVGCNCCKEFLCGENYYLRLDIKGSPALRYLNHNAYINAHAYTGCCPEGSIAPTPVDSTIVFIQWANAILRYPVTSPFVRIVVQDQTGVLWYAPGTPAAFLASVGGDTWDNYVSPGYIEDACAGMVFDGAYVDTKFGDCTFQLTDFYEKEPVKLYASEVDLNGDPCAFEGLCVVHECLGTQANGLGETVLRDLTLSESYRQSFLHSDFRIREITQGNQIIASIDRNALYFSYYIQHNVPRHNNPTGTFDSDQYLLQVVSLNALTTFATNTADWLAGCGVCEFEEVVCETNCESVITFPDVPVAQRIYI
jgi:hypothetical protein